MEIISVAQAKAHLSEILSKVEAGEEMQITRRGRVIARVVPEPRGSDAAPFDFEALAAFVDAQPTAAAHSVTQMRTQDVY